MSVLRYAIRQWSSLKVKLCFASVALYVPLLLVTLRSYEYHCLGFRRFHVHVTLSSIENVLTLLARAPLLK